MVGAHELGGEGGGEDRGDAPARPDEVTEEECYGSWCGLVVVWLFALAAAALGNEACLSGVMFEVGLGEAGGRGDQGACIWLW